MPQNQQASDLAREWFEGQGISFEGELAAEAYRARARRILEAVRLREPDRVPVCPLVGFFPVYYAGLTVEEAMYDAERACRAWEKYVEDFEPDAFQGPGLVWPGRALELLDYKLLRWPGHGTAPDTPYQYVEGEYMKPEEYDALIEDPSDFWLRYYFPRIFGALAPLAALPPITDPIAVGNFVPLGRPEVRQALEAALAAGEELGRWAAAVRATEEKLKARGFPKLSGGVSLAPFDLLGDTLRGMRGIMMDMYRRPEKLLKALDRLTPLAVRLGVTSSRAAGHPIVFIPLHKGADGFMSARQFETFYWPSLRATVLGLVDAGLIPLLFAEGGYDSRLEVIRDLPPGKVIWLFDQVDMARAKEVLGEVACIAGNVPGSLLALGTPEEVTRYCRELISVAGRGGGFILSTGAAVDQARPENLRAMMAAVRG
ncbi:MAG: uroporphyrinogen decarboxylase family protein [Moorellales bacterium]